MRWWVVVVGAAAVPAILFLLQPDMSVIASRPLPERPAPDRPLRIVAFGTSLTARSDWVDRLPLALAACGFRDADVVRVARVGANSEWARGMTDVVKEKNPDLVIAEFSINDADLFDGLWPWQSRANIDEVLSDLQDFPNPPEVLLMSTSPVAGPAQTFQRPYLAFYQAMYAGIAAGRDVGYLNATALWAGADLRQDLPDGVHPLPEREAALVLPALARMIARGFGRDCAGSSAP